MHIEILHLHPNATTPTYATDGAACFDLYAAEDCTIAPGERRAVRTGIAMALPRGTCLDIRSRSGLAFKHGIEAFAGTIDADFRGEILVLLCNHSGNVYHVQCGDRIAQGRPLYPEAATFWRVEQLNITERGAGGFGSTGA